MGEAKARRRGIRRAPKIRDCARLRCRRIVWEAANALALHFAYLSERAGSTNPYRAKDIAGECLETFVIDRLPEIFGVSLAEFARLRQRGKSVQQFALEAKAGAAIRAVQKAVS
jgi:hypothetical protein